MNTQHNIVVLASGRGSNFRAVVTAIEEGRISGARISALVTDRPGTGAAQFAAERGIAVRELDFKSFSRRSDFDARLHETVLEFAPHLVLTLGYMRIIAPELVQSFSGRMINIHPSLLPAFPGIRSQKQALDYGVRIAGTTVHYVDTGVDTGPIIRQAAVPVDEGMALEELEARILVEEHRILVEGVALHTQGRLSIAADGRHVLTRGETP